MRLAAFLALMLALALAAPGFPQIDNGNITGRVTDPLGAAIVGAQVNVTQTEMNFETLAATNEEDLYRALNLRPGPYRVTVVAQGFKKLVRESIDLRVGQTLAIDAKLEVGAVSDSIEVTAKAALLETETSATGATLAGDYFYSLPNYQRHPQAVLPFTPGVTFASKRGNNGSNLWDNQRLIAHSLAASKEVPIKERLRLMVRLDFQNPFKWYNWGGPGTGLNVQSVANSKSFGTNSGGGESGTGTAGYGGTHLMNLTLAFKW